VNVFDVVIFLEQLTPIVELRYYLVTNAYLSKEAGINANSMSIIRVYILFIRKKVMDCFHVQPVLLPLDSYTKARHSVSKTEYYDIPPFICVIHVMFMIAS
jgi:hypothetical protein